MDLKRKQYLFEEEAYKGIVKQQIQMREMDATTKLQRIIQKKVVLQSV